MRSRILPSAFFSLSILCASAFAEGNALLLGGGLNFTSFHRDAPGNLPDQAMRTGFNIMAGFQAASDYNGASVFGIGYETRGAVWSDEDSDGDESEATVKFDYLHLAFAYKFLAPNPSVTLYAAPLVDLAILTNSEVEFDGGTADADEVNSIDLDLGLSLGVQVPIGRNAFFMEAGYAYGLFNTVTGDAADDVSMHNSAIKLRAGFLVGI